MENERNSECWYKDVCTQTCSNLCLRFNEMKHLMDMSGLPKNKQIPTKLDAGWDYDEFCRLADIKDNIVEFVQNGDNLYICSKWTGNGKTSWAIKLLLKYFDEIWAGNGYRTRGMFVHVPTLLLRVKDFNSPLSDEYKESLLNCDLVVWDDIASTNLSQYDFSQLFMYVNGRLFQEKSNIFTSNAENQEALEQLIGVRLASRIYNTSEVIRFTGKDRRAINGTVADNQ